ncbi:LysR substrate-binding domain-containing protein [Rhizobium miluonense]|uniref:HTH-type transcriptional regulator TtuA n=1 Tax=Rhizobium miluonense TaxID=411945 RepID=A0A1C3V8B5_9HYPH|nr:LysR substrate-binding domain-containing protein [Rhizobium miluonense]SCB23879.1 DNA-binding transcriptional regulator, LysR family [Rhizobium miluonense]
MRTLRAQIGPLATIFAFEAAARLRSFTSAADELGVTQAAVSKQISLLEERLGTRLFTRGNRNVELTAAGQRLSVSAHAALSSIADTMSDIGKQERKPLTVMLSASLSRFWLMPRMADFRNTNPDVTLRVIAYDELTDAKTKSADLIIRYAPGLREEPSAIRLFGAHVLAMASPEFLKHHPIATEGDVAASPLIHYDTPGPHWISWEDWGRAALGDRHLPPPSLSVSRYHDAIVAAQQGQGVVLVWKVLDGGDPYAEGLIAVPGPEIQAPGAFYLVPLTPDRTETHDAVAWFRTQCSDL